MKFRRTCAVLLTLFLLPFTASWAAERKVLTLPDGTEFDVHIAGKLRADAAILLVHDWFGVTPFTTEAVDRLGALGYRALAVNLYGGKSADTHDGAFKLMQALDRGTALAKVAAALTTLKRNGRKIAVFGFSMGGPIALDAAAVHGDAIDAAVVWYSDVPKNEETLRKLRLPILAVFGSADGPAAQSAAAFSQALDNTGGGAEIFIYPGAAHAFAQPLFNAGKTYDARATAASWVLTEDFLKRRLRSGH